jgi:hypothetical protein
MKQLSLFVSGAVLVCFLIVPAWADSGAGTPKTAVSQTQIDTVKKREEAKKQQTKKMKVRAKNTQKSPKSNSELFQRSK